MLFRSPKKSESGLLTSIAWGIDGKITYLFEGVVMNSGSTIQYLRDEMRFLEGTSDSEFFAKKAKMPKGTAYFLPMFSGVGAPYWDANAKGALFGLTRGIDKNDIILAALDSGQGVRESAQGPVQVVAGTPMDLPPPRRQSLDCLSASPANRRARPQDHHHQRGCLRSRIFLPC